MKKKNYIITGAVLVAVIICIFAVWMFYINESKTWNEYYDTGLRYLNEGKYDEAIAEFTSAIKVDDKQAVVYIARGDSYVGKAEALLKESADRSQQAKEIYEQAKDDYQTAAELGNKDAESKLNNIEEMLQSYEKNLKYETQLSELYNRFDSGNIESAVELAKQNDYRDMNGDITDGKLYYEEGGQSALGVYPDGFYYFGNWKDGERSGHGIWIQIPEDDSASGEHSSLRYYMFEGEWANDAPNGEGVSSRFFDDKNNEGSTSNKEDRISGNYTNGLANGSMSKNIMREDGSVITYTVNAVNGVDQSIPYPAGMESASDPRCRLVAIDSRGIMIHEDNNVRNYVWGFKDNAQG